jgi:flagellar protein FlgJ
MDTARGAYWHELTRLHDDIVRTVAEGFDADDAAFAPVPAQADASIAALLASGATGMSGRTTSSKQDFLANILPFARKAADELGVSEDLIAAHAALESGWGNRPLTGAQGDDTFNLFGIKAADRWQGGVADVLTTEYIGGDAIKTVQRFRAYSSYDAAFDDYVRLLRDNPRYRGVIGAGGDVAAFAQALVSGGYATDPAYVSKLRQVASDVAASRADMARRSGTTSGEPQGDG